MNAMNAVLRIGIQFYARTRVQRWLLAIASLLFTAQALVLRLACPCSWPLSLWSFSLGGLGSGVTALVAISSAWDFRRISALRTVYLIPHSRLKLAGGLLLAQLIAGGAGACLGALRGAHPAAPLAWGSPLGTFEMTFGCALSLVVLLQVVTGPSRILSVAGFVLGISLLLRPDVFMKPEILGMPKAHVLALAGIFAWCSFTVWYVNAWRPAAPLSIWNRGRSSAAAALPMSRQRAIHVLLLGQPSLESTCRQQIALWLIYHATIVATMAAMKLLTARHHHPANYSMAILVLLYGPVVGVNTIAAAMARGSRRVWLRGGEARQELYAIAARLAWRSLALLGIPLFGLALIEARFLPHPGIDMLLPTAICVTLTPSALYLGLMNFQRRLNLSFLALYLVTVGAPLAGMWVESSQAQRLLWMAPAALIAIGCVLRSLARRRWHDIDWLKFRAPRETLPFAVRRA
jgi:hypothetical protein